jgi:hypothetical protein
MKSPPRSHWDAIGVLEKVIVPAQCHIGLIAWLATKLISTLTPSLPKPDFWVGKCAENPYFIGLSCAGGF